MIGFYVKGSRTEREAQIAELFCFVMLYKLNRQQIVFYEDDEYDWEAFNFLVKNPIIPQLIITNPDDFLLDENELEEMKAVLQTAQIELINIAELNRLSDSI